MKRTPLRRRTPLKANPEKVAEWQNKHRAPLARSTKPMARSTLRRVSPEQKKELAELAKINAAYLKRNPDCHHCLELGKDPLPATVVHHTAKRAELLKDTRFFMAVNGRCHTGFPDSIEANRASSRARGWLLSIGSSLEKKLEELQEKRGHFPWVQREIELYEKQEKPHFLQHCVKISDNATMNKRTPDPIICTGCNQSHCVPCGKFARVDYKTRTGLCKKCAQVDNATQAAESFNLHIPKFFHQIWLGKNPMPPEFKRYRQSWKDNHPGWKYFLWTDDHLPYMQNRALFDSARTLSEKSDVLRYELLYQFGGVYADTDVECFKNIEPLLRGRKCVVPRMTDRPLASAVMACEKGDTFFQAAITRLPGHYAANPKASPPNSTGPFYLSRFVKEFPHVHILEPHFVFPYEPRTKEAKQLWQEKGKAAFPQAFTAHHWVGSWIRR